MGRRIELLRGHRLLECCSRGAAWHRLHGRTFKLGEVVTVGNDHAAYGCGVVTGNSGEHICCRDVRNRFLLEVTYDDGSIYHCLPCEVWSGGKLDPTSIEQSSELVDQGMSINVLALNGMTHKVTCLAEDMLVLEFRKRLAQQLGQHCWWLVKISVGSVVPQDHSTLREAGLTDSTTSVAFVMEPRDKRAWQWVMARLLQALRIGDDVQIRYGIEEAMKANRSFDLAHLVKKVCLAGHMDILADLLKRVPTIALCDALVIMRGSVNDRYKHRNACVFYQLWEHHFESFKAVCGQLFEAGCLEKLHGMLGHDLPERMFANCFGKKGSPTWMDPLLSKTREELEAALNEPANQPKQESEEFTQDVLKAGFSLRDLEAIGTHVTNSGFFLRPERFNDGDFACLPHGIKMVLMKWSLNKKCTVCRRPWDWDEACNGRDSIEYRWFKEGYAETAIRVLVPRSELVVFAKSIPAGLELLYGDTRVDERIDHAEELAADLPTEPCVRVRHQCPAPPTEARTSRRTDPLSVEKSKERQAAAKVLVEKERRKRGKEKARMKARDEKNWVGNSSNEVDGGDR